MTRFLKMVCIRHTYRVYSNIESNLILSHKMCTVLSIFVTSNVNNIVYSFCLAYPFFMICCWWKYIVESRFTIVLT